MLKERNLKRKLQRKEMNKSGRSVCKKEGKSAEDRFIDG
jgi:hypothetical protein